MSDKRRELLEAAPSAPEDEKVEDSLSVWAADVLATLPSPHITASFSLADGKEEEAKVSREDWLTLESTLLKARLACMEFANFEFVANLATRKHVLGRPSGLRDDFVISRNVTKEAVDQLIHEIRKMRHRFPESLLEAKVREHFMQQGPFIRPYWQEEHVDDFQMTLDRIRRVQAWVAYNFGASVLRPRLVQDGSGWNSSSESESDMQEGDPLRARDGFVSRWRKDIGQGPWWGLLKPHQEWYQAEPRAPTCQERMNGQT